MLFALLPWRREDGPVSWPAFRRTRSDALKERSIARWQYGAGAFAPAFQGASGDLERAGLSIGAWSLSPSDAPLFPQECRAEEGRSPCFRIQAVLPHPSCRRKVAQGVRRDGGRWIERFAGAVWSIADASKIHSPSLQRKIKPCVGGIVGRAT